MNHFVKRIQFFLTSYWMPAIGVGLTFCLYFQTYSFEFTNWDDGHFVRDNPLLKDLTSENIYQLFSLRGIPDELLYIPLTYLSFLVEGAITGGKPGTFHLTNTLLHASNVVLVFYTVRGWSEDRSIALIVSILFAIHPLQVEAVSWIMGRKDLLSTFFSLLCIMKYRKVFESGDKGYYPIVIFSFICALLCKPTAVILPIILVLVIIFRRYKLKSIDFSLLLLMCLISIGISKFNNALAAPNQSLLSLELIYLQVATIPYLISGWIARLCLFSRPNVFYSSSLLISPENITIEYAILSILIIFLLIWAFRQGFSPLWFGILFTLTAFLPSLSLVFYANREFFTADRYGYFALIAVFYSIVYTLKCSNCSLFNKVYLPLLSIWMALCVVTTNSMIQVWRNSEALWKYALSLDPTNPIAHNLLGNHYYEEGRLNDAIQEYLKAVKCQPGYVKGFYNLGRVYSDTKRYDMAIRYYKRALRIKPDHIDSYQNLGIIFLNSNSFGKALAAFNRVIKLDPENVNANYCIGLVYKRKGDFETALGVFNRLLHFAPGYAKAHFQSAITYHRLGQLGQAIQRYKKSLEHDPTNYKAHYNLGVIYLESGQYPQALTNLLAAKKTNFYDSQIQSKLGITWLNMQEYEKAVDAFLMAISLDKDLEEVHNDLGTALYYLGRHKEALYYIKEARKRGYQVKIEILEDLTIDSAVESGE